MKAKERRNVVGTERMGSKYISKSNYLLLPNIFRHIVEIHKKYFLVAHICNPSTQEAKARGSRI